MQVKVRRRPVGRRIAVGLLVLATTTAVVPEAGAEVQVVPLQPAAELVGLPGYDMTQIEDINDRGTIVGFARTGSGLRAALRWDAGGNLTKLDSGGAPVTMATAVNGQDTVVGLVGPGEPARWKPARWNASGRLTTLDLLPGHSSGEALDINERGEATGREYTGTGSQAVRWDRDGRVTPLEMPPGDVTSIGAAINDDGVVAGSVVFDGGSSRSISHAARWDARGRLLDLGAALPTGADSTGWFIDESGDVVGYLALIGWDSGHAARWDRHGRVTDLGTLGGGQSYATDVNGRGVVVGGATTAEGDQAVRWDRHGRIEVLALLPGASNGVATGVNDWGDVVGVSSQNDGVGRATLWDRRGHRVELAGLPGGGSTHAGAITNTGIVTGNDVAADGRPRLVVWRPVRV